VHGCEVGAEEGAEVGVTAFGGQGAVGEATVVVSVELRLEISTVILLVLGLTQRA
jgi:hypothetical protein